MSEESVVLLRWNLTKAAVRRHEIRAGIRPLLLTADRARSTDLQHTTLSIRGASVPLMSLGVTFLVRVHSNGIVVLDARDDRELTRKLVPANLLPAKYGPTIAGYIVLVTWRLNRIPPRELRFCTPTGLRIGKKWEEKGMVLARLKGLPVDILRVVWRFLF